MTQIIYVRPMNVNELDKENMTWDCTERQCFCFLNLKGVNEFFDNTIVAHCYIYILQLLFL